MVEHMGSDPRHCQAEPDELGQAMAAAEVKPGMYEEPRVLDYEPPVVAFTTMWDKEDCVGT